jgi:hypothetical protein
MLSSNAVRDDFPNSNLVQQWRDFLLRGLMTALVVVVELINVITGDKTSIKCNLYRNRVPNVALLNGQNISTNNASNKETVNTKKEPTPSAVISSSQCIYEGNCQITPVKMLILKFKWILLSVISSMQIQGQPSLCSMTAHFLSPSMWRAKYHVSKRD